MAKRQAGAVYAAASLVVNCEPNGRHRLVGPRNAMTYVSVDLNISLWMMAAGADSLRLGEVWGLT